MHQLKKIIETIAVNKLTSEERVEARPQSKTVDARKDALRDERIMAVIRVQTPYNMTIHHFSSMLDTAELMDEDDEEDDDDEDEGRVA